MSKSGGFNLKRTVCAVATATLAASGLFVSAAQAAESDLSYGDINTSGKGTVTIHKFETGSLNGQASPGNDSATGHGIEGVTFKLFKINVDLGTPEGWRTISQVTQVPGDACDAQTGASNFAAFTNPSLTADAAGDKEGTSAVGGAAAVAEVPVGAYLVCEQPANAAKNKDKEAVSVVKRSAPFIVTVPRPHEDRNGGKGWIYDVHAFPKNTVVAHPKKASSIKKKAATTDAGIEYTITSKVPNLKEAGKNHNFKFFSVIDQMPAQLSDASVTSVAFEGELNPIPQENWTVDSQPGKNFLAVNFTSAGLTYLKQHANKKLVVTIQAKVNALSKDKIENTGYLVLDVHEGDVPGQNPPTPVTPGGPGKTPTPTPESGNPPIKPSNKSASLWGDILIKKHDASNTGTGLNGAVFQVFEPVDETACEAAAVKVGAERYTAKKEDPINFGTDLQKKVDFTTVNGQIVIPGLYIAHGEASGPDAEVTLEKETRCYVVQEKEAPAGYVLPEENKRTFAVLVKAGTSVDADLDMPNTKVSVPALPLTGASGRVLLMVGGLALVLGSMGVVMVIRKRNAEA